MEIQTTFNKDIKLNESSVIVENKRDIKIGDVKKWY